MADKPKRKKWIQGADIKKGAFTEKANAAGKSVHEYAVEKQHASGTLGKQARLALTFEGMNHSRSEKAKKLYRHPRSQRD